jgi:hypothetical protein
MRARSSKANWDPIIPRADWEAVRAILTDPARRTTVAGGTPRSLLSGVAVCGLCGKKLYALTRRRASGPIVQYTCSKNSPAAGCDRVARKTQDVDALVARLLFLAVEGQRLDRMVADRATPEDPAGRLREELARDQGILERMAAKYLMEALPELAYKTAKAEVEARMDTTRAKLARLEGKRVQMHVPSNLRDV